MGLITETNAQYYSGQQVFNGDGVKTSFICNFNTDLVATTSSTNANFIVTVNSVIVTNFTLSNNIITFPSAPANLSIVLVQLQVPSVWENYGSYQYISLDNIINNFLVAYIGEDKLIAKCKRTDVMFHAKRGLQEFSYDTLKSVNSQELTIPPSLSLAIPQDYVNYVQLSWVDATGVKHIIYPTRLTSNPKELPLQDSAGVPTQGNFGQNLQAAQSITDTRWANNNNLNITGQLTNQELNSADIYDWQWWKMAFGQRYGLEPEVSQKNGWFTINEREGKFSFSSGLVGKIIILEYISDGLASDASTKVPKMAEDALYAHINHSILSTKANTQEYIVQRYQRERSAKLRNAKIRLSNIKLGEIVQVMRGKSKWLKH